MHASPKRQAGSQAGQDTQAIERGTLAHALTRAAGPRDPERAPRVGYPQDAATAGLICHAHACGRPGVKCTTRAGSKTKDRTNEKATPKLQLSWWHQHHPEKALMLAAYPPEDTPSHVAQAPAEIIARPHLRFSRNCKAASLRSGAPKQQAKSSVL